MNEWHTFEAKDPQELNRFMYDIKPDIFEYSIKIDVESLRDVYVLRWLKKDKLTDEQIKRRFPNDVNVVEEPVNDRKAVIDELNELIHNSPIRIPKEVMDGLKHALDYIEKN